MLKELFGRRLTIRHFLGFQMVFWLMFGLIIQNGGSLHGDMLEAYFWGQNPSLGYYKHPPFWALVTTVWFAVFPVANWAFLLLCSLNVTIGLAFIWAIFGRYADDARREFAFTLVFLTPFYTFMAFQFNANTIFYSLWPATLYYFLRSLEDDAPSAAWLFGMFGAFMMLSKYSAIFLLLTCFAVSLVHPRRAHYYRSRAPWIAIGVAVLICLPHFYWLTTHHFTTITYVEAKLKNSFSYVMGKAFDFVVSLILQHVVVIALILVGLVPVQRERVRNAFGHYRAYATPILQFLAFAPAILFFFGGILASIKLSVNLTNPFLFLIPLTLTFFLSDAQVEKLQPVARKCVGFVFIASIVIAPVASVVIFKYFYQPANEPLVELSRESQALWDQTMSTPLKFVTSADGSSAALSFYAKDHPKQWTDMNFDHAPWVTEDDLCRNGVMSICQRNSDACIHAAHALAPDKAKSFDLTVRRNLLGLQGSEKFYVVTLLPPQFCSR